MCVSSPKSLRSRKLEGHWYKRESTHPSPQHDLWVTELESPANRKNNNNGSFVAVSCSSIKINYI